MKTKAEKSGRTTRLADKYIQKLLSNPNRPIKISDHSYTVSGHLALMRLIVNRVNTEHDILLHSDPIHRTLTYKTDQSTVPEWKETWWAFIDLLKAMYKWFLRRLTFNNVLRVLALIALIKILLIV